MSERSEVYMQCISCGKKLTEKDKICPKCGKSQPLAETETITKCPNLKSLSPIFLLIGLIITPLALIGITILIFVSIYEEIPMLKFIFGLINIIFVTIVPFLLALIFRRIK